MNNLSASDGDSNKGKQEEKQAKTCLFKKKFLWTLLGHISHAKKKGWLSQPLICIVTRASAQ